MGVLAALPENMEETLIFVDVYRMNSEVSRLMEKGLVNHRHNLPRKRARYDNISTRHRRVRHMEKKELFKQTGT